ncbi:MAG: hypothetical protein KBE65_14100 [Phycisphaerae bacterium]|nr:hypothetical protein [Phycisphaerae bacterium]
MNEESIAIAYLPWADLKEEFTIGPVSFWPFHSKAEEKIPDVQVRSGLTRFFATFVDNLGRPVKTVVACSCGDISSRKFTPEEYQAIDAAVDCLIFATIATGTKNAVCADNSSMAPPLADRFDLGSRWIWPKQDGLVTATENSLNYWSHGEYKVTKPISVGGHFCGGYESLLQGLSHAFDSKFPQGIRDRLFRSLEWFRFAHTESTAVSSLHKVVMMATAYEILLDFPDSGKRRYFIREIDSKLRLPESCIVELQDGRGGTFEVCKAAEWGGQFYELRNKITHGDQVSYEQLLYKGWVTHLIVADLVMLELVKRLLYEHVCIGEDSRKCLANFAPICSDSPEVLEATLLPGALGLRLDDVHEALGWTKRASNVPRQDDSI